MKFVFYDETNKKEVFTEPIIHGPINLSNNFNKLCLSELKNLLNSKFNILIKCISINFNFFLFVFFFLFIKKLKNYRRTLSMKLTWN